MKQASEFGFKAVATTEHGNCYSLIDAFKAAQKYNLKFIPGCEIYEVDDLATASRGAREKRYHLILLAKNDIGFRNLNQLVTIANTEGAGWKPIIDLKTIAQHSEGLICLSACLAGRIARMFQHESYDLDEIITTTQKYKDIFGDDFYLELQSHDNQYQSFINKHLVQLAELTNTKYTITFDSHMLNAEQQQIHRYFVKIGERDVEDIDTYKDCWQTDIATIHENMDSQIGYDAVEVGINTTDEIADKVNVNIQLHQDLMPHIKIPDGFKTEQEYLKYLVNQGWKKRGLNKLPSDLKQQYLNRLQNEFEVLDYLGYCSYFIMLYQLINRFKEEKIPLGYSRGSGANCLTLYVIGVTEIDSIKWNLDFTRFGNKGRKGSPADYDIDLGKDERHKSIEITIDMYGKDNVAHMATFNSLSAKVALKDVGKVFHEEGVYNLPYPLRDKIAKLVPDGEQSEKMTIEKALESSSELRKYAEQYPLLFEYTKVLQNIEKSVGCHASAIAISDQPLMNFCPLMYTKDGDLMLQLEMHNAMDDVGIVKMDYLGLVTLNAIENTLNLAGLTWDDINLNKLNLDDQNVLSNIYGKGNTIGIFQMETPITQNMYKEMLQDSISKKITPLTVHDVIAVSALVRPANMDMGMDEDYIHNKHHKEDMMKTLIHPELEPIFGPTNGVMLYQESALAVFRLAGFSEEDTDSGRRAIGKKKPDVMATLEIKLREGLTKRGWSEEQIKRIWELLVAQASYSFNLGHATSYGLLSYVTAYLKYYYPTEFMTALLISVIGDYAETTKYIHECHNMGIKVLPPDINKSGRGYTIHNNQILYGIEAIKGVGESAVEVILAERSNGPFTSLQDFINRCKLDTSTITSLIKAGCFGLNKDELLISYAESRFEFKLFKSLTSLPTKAKLKELDVIRTDEEFKNKEACLRKYNLLREELHWKEQEEKHQKHLNEFKEKYMSNLEMYEFETLNIFIADANPFEIAQDIIKPFEYYEEGGSAVIGGTITDIKYGKQKNGARYARLKVLTLTSGMLEGVCFSKQYTTYQSIIKKGQNVVILAEKSDGQFKVDQMKTLDQWKEDMKHKLKRVG